MTNSTVNPEKCWAEMIDEFGDDHSPLTPKLAQAFAAAPYGLMEQVSWFKFAGKMIGRRDLVMVYDHLEGLGGWTVACETGPTVAILNQLDPLDEIRKAWPDEKILFENHDEILRSTRNEFDGIVRFGAADSIIEAEWEYFIADSAAMLKEGGSFVVGIKNELKFIFIKKIAKEHFNHVFEFGKGQPHPVLTPANINIILAC
ncbi:MAG TPA: hypothetical protein DCS48_03795 [Desulfovibrio sp.]|nr:hypothetical protein [Desulfovibrio sp.]